MNRSQKLLITSLIACSPLQVGAVEHDKKLHLVAGVGIATIAKIYTDDTATTFLLCGGAGLAKELLDEYEYGGFDEKDLVFTLAGCFVGNAIGNTALYLFEQDNTVGVGYKVKF